MRSDIPGSPSVFYVDGAVSASALPLLMARVFADDHDASVPADHLALVAHALDARLNLHTSSSFFLVVEHLSGSTSRGLLRWSSRLPVTVNDAASGQVVRRELHDYAITWQNADVVLPHLP